jgi:hypothetical protein
VEGGVLLGAGGSREGEVGEYGGGEGVGVMVVELAMPPYTLCKPASSGGSYPNFVYMQSSSSSSSSSSASGSACWV